MMIKLLRRGIERYLIRTKKLRFNIISLNGLSLEEIEKIFDSGRNLGITIVTRKVHVSEVHKLPIEQRQYCFIQPKELIELMERSRNQGNLILFRYKGAKYIVR